MELKGKKIFILGDSITEGAGTTAKEYRYTEVFRSISGANVLVDGIGGTRIARQNTPSENTRYDLCFLDRASAIEEGCDVIVVFGGTNDFGHGDALMGSFDNKDDEFTFYGAMHSLITRIVNKNPDATVVFMTPLHRTSENEVKVESDNKAWVLKDYVNVIREVCEYYSVPVLDLYSMSGLQPAIPVIKEKFMPDGLHPSNAGAKIIAERLYAFLSAL